MSDDAARTSPCKIRLLSSADINISLQWRRSALLRLPFAALPKFLRRSHKAWHRESTAPPDNPSDNHNRRESESPWWLRAWRFQRRIILLVRRLLKTVAPHL